jgi:hypothetical protein
MVLRTSLTGARVLIVKSLHSPDQQAGRHELSTNLLRRFTPETTPLLLDYVDVHPRPLKSGKNVVYMDDHVAPLDAAAD